MFEGARVVLGCANSTGEYIDHNVGSRSLTVSLYCIPTVSKLCEDIKACAALDAVFDKAVEVDSDGSKVCGADGRLVHLIGAVRVSC